eukprot:234011-Chlamydomonas_euryale.AAC.1
MPCTASGALFRRPENVLLKMQPTRPAGLLAKLTDFGLSATLEPGLTHVSNMYCGTPCYVCPTVVKVRACVAKGR